MATCSSSVEPFSDSVSSIDLVSIISCSRLAIFRFRMTSLFSKLSSFCKALANSFSKISIVLLRPIDFWDNSCCNSWLRSFSLANSSSKSINDKTSLSSTIADRFSNSTIWAFETSNSSIKEAFDFWNWTPAPNPWLRKITISDSRSSACCRRILFSSSALCSDNNWDSIELANSVRKLSTSKFTCSASSKLSCKILIVPSASWSWETACLVSTDSPNPADFIREISVRATSSSLFKSRTSSFDSLDWSAWFSCSASNWLRVFSSCNSKELIIFAESCIYLSLSSLVKTSSTFAWFNSSRSDCTTWSKLPDCVFCVLLVSSSTVFKSSSWPAITFTTSSSSLSFFASAWACFNSKSLPSKSSSLLANWSNARFCRTTAESSSTCNPSINSVALLCSDSKRLDKVLIRASESARFLSISSTNGIAGNLPSDASRNESWATCASSSSRWIVVAYSNSLRAIFSCDASNSVCVFFSFILEIFNSSSNDATRSTRSCRPALFIDFAFSTSRFAALRSIKSLFTYSELLFRFGESPNPSIELFSFTSWASSSSFSLSSICIRVISPNDFLNSFCKVK